MNFFIVFPIDEHTKNKLSTKLALFTRLYRDTRPTKLKIVPFIYLFIHLFIYSFMQSCEETFSETKFPDCSVSIFVREFCRLLMRVRLDGHAHSYVERLKETVRERRVAQHCSATLSAAVTTNE
jgi:hypothetical protein